MSTDPINVKLHILMTYGCCEQRVNKVSLTINKISTVNLNDSTIQRIMAQLMSSLTRRFCHGTITAGEDIEVTISGKVKPQGLHNVIIYD